MSRSLRICALLALLLALPMGALAEGAIGDMGYAMLGPLYDEVGQFVCSPASLKLAMSMAAEGAQGQTRAQLLSALHMADPTPLDLAQYSQLRSANAALVSPMIELLEPYKERLTSAYGAEVFPLAEDVVAQVNAWAHEHTEGMISQLLGEQPSAQLRLVLLNALLLDADWQHTFDPNSTKDAKFQAPGGAVKIPFMRQSQYFEYAEGQGSQAVKLPYVDGQLEMVVILPKKGGMKEALALLAGQGLDWLGEFTQQAEVNLSLPKLSMESSLQLNDLLKGLGVEEAFSMDADFSGMTGAPDLYIDEVLQRVRLDVDEDGTRAAAVTGMFMDGKGFSFETVDMVVDRPYIALVRAVDGGELLFAAVVENPAQSA